jgi:hypothetical protein
MRIEIEFIILEGAMIVITVTVMTVFHPGQCLPSLVNTMVKKSEVRESEQF